MAVTDSTVHRAAASRLSRAWATCARDACERTFVGQAGPRSFDESLAACERTFAGQAGPRSSGRSLPASENHA